MLDPNIKLTANLSENELLMKQLFHNDQTLIVRYVVNQHDSSIRSCIFYIDGLVDNKIINEDIIRPFTLCEFPKTGDLIDVVAQQVTSSNSVEKAADMEAVIHGIVYGDTILLVEGSTNALVLNTKGWQTRSISEPENEKVLRGPREGFVESLLINLSMLRRRFLTQDLKMEYQTFGARSHTKGCICYIDGLVNPKILNELKNRLQKFNIDGTLDVNYISEFIHDAPYSPIKTIGSTERPDVVAGKLLEGRIALFLDGTPMVLTLPHLFIEHFQSNDDYYINFYFSSIGRLLRLLGFMLSVSVPAVYVALTTFHQELLPTDLTISIAMARQGVPLPTVIEAFVMLIVFEILRETGMRAPSAIGQTLSIVGVLVIGQAAVDAKLISAPMIIIIGLSGITGIMLPKIKGTIIILRYILLLLASTIGLYGYFFGVMGFLLYLFTIRSFGVPIMNSNVVDNFQENKDIYIRMPWWYMIKRPKFMSYDNVRTNSDGDPQ